MDQILVGPLLPAGAPDELESLRKDPQVLAGGGRKVMRDAVYRKERARWTFVHMEAEQGDDPVHVDEQPRNMAICGQFHVPSVTQPGCGEAARVSKIRVGFKSPSGGADRGTPRRRRQVPTARKPHRTA